MTIPAAVASDIRLAAHAITWNIPRDDAAYLQWFDDVVDAGYDGIAMFGMQVEDFIDRPAQLKQWLEERSLQLAAVTGFVDDTPEWAERMMGFMVTMGTEHLACTDFDTTLTLDRAVDILDERAATGESYGIKVYYHNHTGGVAETMTQLEELYSRLDPAHSHLMLDVGHATKDFPELPPEERATTFLERHWGDFEYLELKDWNEETDLNTPLGEGLADVPAIMQLVAGGGYRGWIVVEQNGNLGLSRGRSPVESAKVSRDYLREFGL